jgi:hypothetical protein
MTRKSDLTLAQAQDLARHFLGREWRVAETVGDAPREFALHRPGCGYVARTWRAVFRLAGVKLPVRPQFVAVKDRIMRYTHCVGVMASPTFAARTANALNEYEPDRHGL